MPDETTIEAVRQSCAGIPTGSPLLAESFYAHLFEMRPELRSMFAADLGPQERRMADALLQVVRHLDRPDELSDYLRQLGAQHQRKLGVEPEHYPHIGRALVRAVRDISPTWSTSTSSSWVTVYEWITAVMVAGAEEGAEPQRSGVGRVTHGTGGTHREPPRP
ncbi:globin domain-containing protein [Spiractinospora alimapuensis]|uniref:globin domain-containing protein n=1 Tax=Spiractinospora alimapuensis TaxID=2820884 RepID=UPI003743263F